ncbi:MAG: helix-turn-helix domain-containing protein [SAR86 cluster bacterium]|uniref:Helix-turn-helix domain-containing protein n=1 Tax=SAR86 cluster bacterium TaxID=2030880 RepID=A0A838XUG9_9GAMM|nr:helix-turn-helix domain-containing protein [SAR86 cluster bacterium]
MNLKSAQTAKVGKIFKDARLQKSLSLAEVSIEAVINIEYIRAIESGDYSVFPARTYALKYFEKYANFLSIEATFFDIFNLDLIGKAAREEKLRNHPEPFLEKNKIFSSLLVVITLIAIIFLVILGDSIDEKSEETSTNPVMLGSLELNVDPEQRLKSEIHELNNQINDFLFTDKLDSNESNVNVDPIVLDE